MTFVRNFFLAAAVTFGICSVSAQSHTVKHTVDKGENLSSIAKRYGTTESKIIELNPDAAQFVYVGMELTIPVIEVSGAVNTSNYNTGNQTYNNYNYKPSNDNEQKYSSSKSFEREFSHPFFVVAQYQMGDFNVAKESGWYGLGMVASSIVHWGSFHIGADVNFLIDAGFVDDWGCKIDFGPSVRFDIADNIFVNIPVNAVCIATFPEGSTDTKTDWGAMIAPSFYAFFSEKFGLFAGPQATFSFKSGSEPSFGFVAGLSYSF